MIGPRRDLILARLEGGPLATTGVIAGMSGQPGLHRRQLVGAVSYAGPAVGYRSRAGSPASAYRAE